MHTAQEIGIDDFQASRSSDKQFYRDGRFKALDVVVARYTGVFKLQLSEEERKNLIEFLKSL